MRAVVLLPGTVTLLIPALLVSRTKAVSIGWGLPSVPAALALLLGAALIGLGLVLVTWTVALFATAGQGTLAPWDPPSKLVVRGPYRHVRNPMISGVASILAGEAALLGSAALLIWLGAFVAVNALYLPLVEERGLRRRYGADYDLYRTHVPRWLPRLRPWSPRGGSAS